MHVPERTPDWPKRLYEHAGGREWSTDDHGDLWKHAGSVEVVPVNHQAGAVSVERDALDYITGGIDREPWVTIYRDAGGGYAGLQAVARAALDAN